MTAAAGFECLAEGKGGKILLAPKALAEWQALERGRNREDIKRRVKLRKHFDEMAANGPGRLNDEQFKREGSFPDGAGGAVSIWVFKVWQWRLYGAFVTIEGAQCFVGVRVDPSKKRDRADQDLLKAVAKEIGGLVEYQAGQKRGGDSDERAARKRR
ncbi:hypothetical protein [Methylorubrum sp. SL192]|uniref:hypothetical protein n=1 Tax=Methylorubrum sp. SL192 TaxID=2995167 RepID=UPI00227328F9|nr:hypothetical protein [Methylorubrum sp. SL192]MCY1642110.1 hypothetical protein [Methylorubrum sp. SL192]